MISEKIKLPCDAYIGDEPYVFISYSHKDATHVYPEIERLSNMGYRIWYDEGISPAHNWSDEIAVTIRKSALVLTFLSNNSISSKHVCNEINYALVHDKPFLPIHISETSLPPGLEMQLTAIQAILKWCINEDVYIKKLKSVLKKVFIDPKDTCLQVDSQKSHKNKSKLDIDSLVFEGSAPRKDSYDIFVPTLVKHIVQCPSCGQQMRVRTGMPGKMYKCANCDTLIKTDLSEFSSKDLNNRESTQLCEKRTACYD